MPQLLSTKMFIPLSSFHTARGKDFFDEILDELSSARLGDPNYENAFIIAQNEIDFENDFNTTQEWTRKSLKSVKKAVAPQISNSFIVKLVKYFRVCQQLRKSFDECYSSIEEFLNKRDDFRMGLDDESDEKDEDGDNENENKNDSGNKKSKGKEKEKEKENYRSGITSRRTRLNAISIFCFNENLCNCKYYSC